MKGWKGLLIAAFCIWVAAALQESVAWKLAIFGARPEFLLVVLATLCMFTNRLGGTLLGFFTGFAFGAIAGANLTWYVVSRSIAGFLDGWSGGLGLQGNIPLAGLNAFFVTIFAELLLMFFIAPKGIASFVAATIGSAIYNGVLAMPMYMLLRRVLGPQGV